MIKFLKLLGKGLLYALLIPLGIVFYAGYGVFLFIEWIVMFFRTVILFFRGKKTGLTLDLDIEAEKVMDEARGPSTQPQPQPQIQQGPQQVSLTINLNGQQLQDALMNSQKIQQQNPDVLDYAQEPEQIEQIDEEGGDE